jgi:hypothetical protein
MVMSSRCPRCTGQFVRELHEEFTCINCGYSPPPVFILDIPTNGEQARPRRSRLFINPKHFEDGPEIFTGDR